MIVSSQMWRHRFYWLVLISVVVRTFLAATLELGNDEVYYRLYALYPDWSHFDHPLMVGLAIQTFSFNLFFDSELFLRMSSIVLGTFNLFIVFSIGKKLNNSRTGFFSALLYSTSIYSFVIAGIFILPDTPQQFFWLLSLRLMIETLPTCPNNKTNGIKMLALGLTIGLAIISKYTSVFLWLGAGLFILLFNREWLTKKWLYLSLLITIVVSLPILIWNLQNDFISFTFHGERVDASGYSLNINYFFTELLGEVLYNNPINYILIVAALILSLRGKIGINKSHLQILLLAGLPLVLLFLVFSLFRSTLPHWTAPGITSLIFLAAIWMDNMAEKKQTQNIPWPLKISVSLILLVLIIGYSQINYGIIKFEPSKNYNHLGTNDPSLDMFGYEQVGRQFAIITERDKANGTMDKNAILIGDYWFPLANFDYYAASPIGMKSYAIGGLDRIHKYAWINEINSGFKKGMDAYYLSDSKEYHEPFEFFDEYFEKIEAADTIQIYRSGKIVKRAFVFRLKNLEKLPDGVLKR